MIAKTTHCKKGHERNSENIYIAPKTGAVGCRVCRQTAIKRWRKENPQFADDPNGDSRAKYKNNTLFGGNREAAVQRDREKCVRCGMTRKEHRDKFGRDITVDHIDGSGRNTEEEIRNNEISNLQTLCLRCHGKKDVVFRSSKIILTEEDVRDIRMFAEAGMKSKDIHKCYRMVSINTIRSVRSGHNWKWVRNKEQS